MVSEAFAQPSFKGAGRKKARRVEPGVGKAAGICCSGGEVSVTEREVLRGHLASRAALLRGASGQGQQILQVAFPIFLDPP